MNDRSARHLSQQKWVHRPPSTVHRPSSILALWLAAALVGFGIVPSGAEVRRERMIGPGVKHARIWRSSGPVAVQVVEVDTTQPFIHLGTSLPTRSAVGVVRLSSQAERLTTEKRYPIAAINGDYFIPERGRFQGVPIGAAIWQREIIHSPYPRSALIVDRAGRSRITILKMRGALIRPDGSAYPVRAVNHPRAADALVVYSTRFGSTTRTARGGVEVLLDPEALPLRLGEHRAAVVQQIRLGQGSMPIPRAGLVASGVGEAAAFLKTLTIGDQVEYRIDFEPELSEGDEVIGGGPRLVRDGRIAVEDEANIIRRTGGTSRHPRTAVGIRSRTAFLVTVDGRRRGYSAGMTLWQLARFMRDLGCADAMALDGGGSTTMWVRGMIHNRPSDGRERAVANGLLVFSTAPRGPAAHLRLTPSDVSLLAGAAIQIGVSAEDRYYNPVRIGPADLRWRVEPPFASVDSRGRLSAAASLPRAEAPPYHEVTAWAEAGEGRSPVRLRVYPAPPRLQVTPAAALLKPGQLLRLAARPLDERGRPLLSPWGAVRWTCPADLGEIDRHGLLRAKTGPLAGWVIASLNGTLVKVPIGVGTIPRAVTGFEEGGNWLQLARPAGARATTEIYRAAARSGACSLRLRYNFAETRGKGNAYARAGIPIGSAVALRLALRGDRSYAALRAKVRDALGRLYLITLCPNIWWAGEWRDIGADIPAGARRPLVLECLYLAQWRPGIQARGAILLDDLRADYAPPLPRETSTASPAGSS